MLSSIFEQDYNVFVDTLETALKSHTPLQTLPHKKRTSICQNKLSDSKTPNYDSGKGISVPGRGMIGNNIHIARIR